MAEDIIIDVKNVWKRYGLPPLLPWKKKEFRESDFALKNISFQIRRGGSLGILGRNGAGKSTLLKLLAGVTPPDKGSIEIRGSIFPMIELNAGISMELTGRENITLLATIVGFKDKDIRRLEPEVIDFSELEDWIDRPVWQYSSGMLARLAFGIAVHARADILLVDEILSVGDLAFQKKCFLKVLSLLKNDTTLLFISQSPYTIERLCQESIILENGYNRLGIMDSRQALEKYLKMTSTFTSDLGIEVNSQRRGTGDIRIQKVYFLEKEIYTFENVNLVIEYTAYEHTDLPVFEIRIMKRELEDITLLSLSSLNWRKDITQGNHKIVFKINKIPLMAGDYTILIKITNSVLIDIIEQAAFFTVKSTSGQISNTHMHGVCYADFTISEE